MSSAGTPKSFDSPRRRSAPRDFRAQDASGEAVVGTIAQPTLVVVVKENCQGCSEFVADEEIIDVPLLVVTASQLASRTYGVLWAPEFIEALDARYAPVYLWLAGDPLEVVTEGTVFSAEQVLAELAAYR